MDARMDKKIFIVDDSLVVRRFMAKLIMSFDGYEVIGTASNGATGVAMLESVNPDIVILDIEMPVMDGLTALPKMLEIQPKLKVIIFSSLTQRNADISIKALNCGAYDCIHKPSSIVDGDSFLEEYTKILKSKLDAAFMKRGEDGENLVSITSLPKMPETLSPKAILIGSSTGGPQAVLKLLKSFKALGINLPILVTQHMPPVFTLSFAKQIEKETGYTCVEGEPGMRITANNVYVAPGDFHMVPDKASAEKINLTQTEKVNFCRPSVDVMFEGYANAFCRGELISIVLTGMGHDGADGSKAVLLKKGFAIAQDEKTSVVWGMPGAVVGAKACHVVLPIEEIGPMVHDVLNNKRAATRQPEKVMV